MPATATCLYCNEELMWVPGRGWVHKEGGVYVMFCPVCNWEGAPYPSPITCPRCGSNRVHDNHCAAPKSS